MQVAALNAYRDAAEFGGVTWAQQVRPEDVGKDVLCYFLCKQSM